MRHDHPDLLDFPVVVPVDIRWGDMDAMGHVNNTVYFRLFEEARIAYFGEAMKLDSADGIAPILHSTSCRFRAPVTYPDRLLAAGRITRVGEDRMTMTHRIVSEKLGRVVAEGEATIVSFDYINKRKAPIPPQWEAHIEAAEGGKEGTDD